MAEHVAEMARHVEAMTKFETEAVMRHAAELGEDGGSEDGGKGGGAAGKLDGGSTDGGEGEEAKAMATSGGGCDSNSDGDEQRR